MSCETDEISTSFEVIIGNSRDMRELPDGSIQLVVTSPPYPMIQMWDSLFSRLDHRIGERLSSENTADIMTAYELMHSQLHGVFRECARTLINGGLCCVNIGDAVRSIGGMFRLFPNHSRVIASLEGLGMTILPYLLWKKPTNRPNAFLGSGFLPTNAYITLDCEFIIIARKGGLRKFDPKDPNRYLSRYSKAERDEWFSQIWEDIPGASQVFEDSNERTAAFPRIIPLRLIKMFSVRGDTVLDPFMGTGTTLLAAQEAGRSFVGYEIDRCAISEKVLQGENVQLLERSEQREQGEP